MNWPKYEGFAAFLTKVVRCKTGAALFIEPFMPQSGIWHITLPDVVCYEAKPNFISSALGKKKAHS